MTFIPAVKPPDQIIGPQRYFLFRNRKLLVIHYENKSDIPLMNDVSELPVALISKKYVGRLNDRHCFACEIDPASGVPENGKFYDLRSVYGLIPEDLFSVAGRALHITDWDNNNKFCGRCGKPLIEREYERAKICSSCDMSYYPKLSP